MKTVMMNRWHYLLIGVSFLVSCSDSSPLPQTDAKQGSTDQGILSDSSGMEDLLINQQDGQTAGSVKVTFKQSTHSVDPYALEKSALVITIENGLTEPIFVPPCLGLDPQNLIEKDWISAADPCGGNLAAAHEIKPNEKKNISMAPFKWPGLWRVKVAYGTDCPTSPKVLPTTLDGCKNVGSALSAEVQVLGIPYIKGGYIESEGFTGRILRLTLAGPNATFSDYSMNNQSCQVLIPQQQYDKLVSAYQQIDQKTLVKDYSPTNPCCDQNDYSFTWHYAEQKVAGKKFNTRYMIEDIDGPSADNVILSASMQAFHNAVQGLLEELRKVTGCTLQPGDP